MTYTTLASIVKYPFSSSLAGTKSKFGFFVSEEESFQKIATELENGDLSLEDSVSKFEEGMKLSKQCNDLLENAEKRITILLKDGEETKEESFVQEEE